MWNYGRMLGLAVSVLLTATALPAAAGDEAWPERPVRIIVPQAPGGTTDATARTVSEKLSRMLGQPFVIDNKPGAVGSIGTQTLLQAKRDGYTFLVAPLSFVAIVPHVQKLPYDPLTDLQPVARVADSYYGMAVHPGLPANDLPEFLAFAKANPGKIAYGSAGIATVMHLAGEIMSRSAGISMLHVPYNGSAAAINDLLAGHIQLVFEGTVFPQAKAGRLKLLAVATRERHPEFPDVPAIRELLPDFEISNWYGIAAAAGTSPAIVERLAARLSEAAEDPELRATLYKVGLSPRKDTPQAMAEDLRRQSQRFGALVKELGITQQ